MVQIPYIFIREECKIYLLSLCKIFKNMSCNLNAPCVLLPLPLKLSTHDIWCNTKRSLCTKYVIFSGMDTNNNKKL